MVTKHQGRATKDFLDILCHLVRWISSSAYTEGMKQDKEKVEKQSRLDTEPWN